MKNSKAEWEARTALIEKEGKIDCSLCGVIKPLSEYPQSRTNRKNRPRYRYCKPCHSATQRRLSLKKKFNISVEEYDKMFLHQGGVCFICKKPPKNVRLNVDHDHKSGLIRGLLCPFCNRVVGMFRDDIIKIDNASFYLKNPPAVGALGEKRYGLKGRVNNKAKTRDRLNKVKDPFDLPRHPEPEEK